MAFIHVCPFGCAGVAVTAFSGVFSGDAGFAVSVAGAAAALLAFAEAADLHPDYSVI